MGIVAAALADPQVVYGGVGLKSAPCVNAFNVPVPCNAGYAGVYGVGYYGKRDADAQFVGLKSAHVSTLLMSLFLAMLVMPVSMVLDTTESVMLKLSSLMLVSMEPTDILLLMVLLLLPLVLPIPPMLEFATILLVLRFPAKQLNYSETYFSSNTLA